MTHSQKILLFALGTVIVLCLVATILFVLNRQQSNNPTDIGSALIGSEERPAYFTDLSGEEVALINENEEQAVVVYTWASWSPFSGEDLALLDSLAQRYPEVEFIALNRAETKNAAQRYLSTIPNYEHLNFVIDTNDTFYAAVDGYAVPETILYSSDGVLMSHLRGALREAEISTILENL